MIKFELKITVFLITIIQKNICTKFILCEDDFQIFSKIQLSMSSKTHVSVFQEQTSDKNFKIRKRTKTKRKKELSSADKRRIEQNKKLHKKLLDIQNGVGRKKPTDVDYDGNERWYVLLHGFF